MQVLLLFGFLLSCKSFIIPKWFGTIGSNCIRSSLFLSDLYFGNLPSGYHPLNLDELLKSKGVNNYSNLSFYSYDPDVSNERYGIVGFSSSSVADSALRVLRDCQVNGITIDVTHRPDFKNIKLVTDRKVNERDLMQSVTNYLKPYSCFLKPIRSENYTQLEVCSTTPELARRAFQVLSNFTHPGCKTRLKTHEVSSLYVDNVHPSIGHATLKILLNTVLKPCEVVSVFLATDKDGKQSAKVQFASRDQALRAVDMVKEKEFMLIDRPLKFRDDSLFEGRVRNYTLFLDNIDYSMTLADVTNLCNDAVGQTLSCSALAQYTSAGVLWGYLVRFKDDETMQKALQGLAGREWNGKKIVPHRFVVDSPRLFLTNLTGTLDEEDLKKALNSVVGEDMIDTVFYKTSKYGERLTKATIVFRSEESRERALEVLPGAVIDGLAVNVTKYLTKYELHNKGEGLAKWDRDKYFTDHCMVLGNVDDSVTGREVMELCRAVVPDPSDVTTAVRGFNKRACKKLPFFHVHFSSEEALAQAIKLIDGSVWGGRKLNALRSVKHLGRDFGLFLRNIFVDWDDQQLADFIAARVGHTDFQVNFLHNRGVKQSYATVFFRDHFKMRQAYTLLCEEVINGIPIDVAENSFHARPLPPASEDCILYLGNVDVHATRADITRLCVMAVGGDPSVIRSIRLRMVEGVQMPYCHIQFTNEEALNKAIEYLNGYEWNGRQLRAARSITKKHPHRLFLRSLSPKLRTDEAAKILSDLLGEEIMSVERILNDAGEPQPCGIACFHTKEQLERTVAKLQGIVIDGMAVSFQDAKD